jgi:hypothetical protein
VTKPFYGGFGRRPLAVQNLSGDGRDIAPGGHAVAVGNIESERNHG